MRAPPLSKGPGPSVGARRDECGICPVKETQRYIGFNLLNKQNYIPFLDVDGGLRGVCLIIIQQTKHLSMVFHTCALFYYENIGLPCGSAGKESACNAGDPVQFLGWKDPLEKGKATHSSILAWRIPWTI